MHYRKPDLVIVHFCKSGFASNYCFWNRHGEKIGASNSIVPEVEVNNNNVTTNPIVDMVEDAAQSMFPTVEVDDDDVNVEEPNIEAIFLQFIGCC